MSDLCCEHGSLRRSCEICERDAEIARLTAEVERLQSELTDAESRAASGSVLKVLALQDENKRLQAVVDAARKQNDYRKGRLKAPNGFLIADELDAALRALDGEP